MCGICGQLNLDSSRPVERDVLSRMCQALRHRGPDDSDIFMSGPVALGSTRLAIIDVAGGHMPLSNEDGTIWIAYNGEVYNFPELRKRLQASGHRFATNSDTETIVHLYEDEGEDCFRKLNGMFALALWDGRKQQLVLARDHLGIKPLFYAHLRDRLIFSSEITGLLPAGLPLEVDRVALHDYLSLNYVPGPRTMLEGVRKLQPGHLLVARPGERQIEVRQYWDFPPQPVNGKRNYSLLALESELLQLLREVVRDTMISDVPVGAFLSGGIDSSLVVALMSEVARGTIKTFSVGFPERSYDESPFAQLVARRFGTDHHELTVRPQVQEVFETITGSFDEPFADNSAVAVYAVSRLAASNVKVVLSGDGGDEVFGGYYTYQADKLAALYRRLPQVLGARLLPSIVEWIPTSFDKASLDFKLKRFIRGAWLPPLPAHYAWKAYLSEEMKASLYGGNGCRPEFRPTVELLQACYDGYPTEDLINRLIYVDSKIQLSDCMLTKVDRMSMAHSLEVRVPLLDQRLVSFMTALPGEFKVKGLKLKYLLKRVAAKVLPPEILRRPKAGFTIPISRWLASDLRERMMDELSPDRVKRQGFFDPHAVRRMAEDHCRGRRDHGRSLWSMLVMSRWHERHFG